MTADKMLYLIVVLLIGSFMTFVLCFNVLQYFHHFVEMPLLPESVSGRDQGRKHEKFTFPFSAHLIEVRKSSERRQATGSNPLSALGSLLGGVSGTDGSSITSELGGLLSSGLSSLGNGLLNDLDGPALFLGIGLGTGTTTGLNLSTAEQANAVASSVAAANDMNATGINGAAMNLGNGLAAAAVPLVASNFSQSNTTSSLRSTIAQAIFPLAQGIGNGTAAGLSITELQFTPANGTGVGDVAGNLGLGLSESLIRSINTAKILNSSILSGLTNADLNLPETFQAAGVGIGQGAAQGFGVMKQTTVSNAPIADNSFDALDAVEAFSSGLTSSFLESADLSTVVAKLGTSPLKKNISLPTIIGGFARGLVDGVVSATSAAGGFSKLLTGNASFSALMNPPTDVVGIGLNNTMSGASIAFGRGLGYEGVLVGGAILSKGISPNSPSANTSANSTASEVPAVSSVLRRDVNTTGIDPIINSTFLSFLTQRGVNVLQCDGIGGLGSIFIGLVESKTIPAPSLTSLKLDNSTASLLPAGTSSVQLDGNTFGFDLQDLSSAKVNGLPIVGFAVVLAFHSKLSFLLQALALTLNSLTGCDSLPIRSSRTYDLELD